jgi:hypothetical protein
VYIARGVNVGNLIGIGIGLQLLSEMRAADYRYSINQTSGIAVSYGENSFFDKNPVQSTVYISDLVDKIALNINYMYTGSEATPLRYEYSATATLSAQYAAISDATTGAAKSSASVWSKSNVLLPTKVATSTNGTITINPEVTVPFPEYRDEVAKLTKGLNVSLDGQVVVTFTVRVIGTMYDAPINDVRTTTVIIPLDEQVFEPKYSIEKTAGAVIAAPHSVHDSWFTCQRVLIGATIALGIGALMLFVGLRRRRKSSAYERELDKIMRYHEGVIVRATSPVDISGKQVMPMRSFDDMLNLEEELRQPIVAVPGGPETMHFIIIHEDVVYRYTIGSIDAAKVKTTRHQRTKKS